MGWEELGGQLWNHGVLSLGGTQRLFKVGYIVELLSLNQNLSQALLPRVLLSLPLITSGVTETSLAPQLAHFLNTES